MKKIFLLLTTLVMMSACAQTPKDVPPDERIKARVTALLTACQHKDVQAVKKNLSPQFPKDHLFLQRFLTTFLSRGDVSFTVTSVKTARQGKNFVAHVGFDTSFKRAAGTRDAEKNVVLHKTGVFTLCPDGAALKICAMSPEDILF